MKQLVLLKSVDDVMRFANYGIKKEDLPKLVEGGMNKARLFVPNPRNLTKEDVQEKIKDSLKSSYKNNGACFRWSLTL